MTNVKQSVGLAGLVVCGGNSSRMGVDKSLLQYYSKPQRYHLYEMLQPCCETVFISCNNDQSKNIEEKYACITDLPAFKDTGPIAGLLSAFRELHGMDLQVTGCDYPFLTNMDLQDFLLFAKNEKKTMAFYNEAAALYEPLLAFYDQRDAGHLLELFKEGNRSLQYFLKEIDAAKFYPVNLRSMQSVDTVEACEAAKTAIEAGF